MRSLIRIAGAVALTAAMLSPSYAADEPVLNLYSARHYQTDEALYDNFTKATGIKINRIEASDEQLLERLKSEGANSPADILLIVDAARLWQAQQLGLFQPIKSGVLDDRIPAKFRDPAGNWFGFSYRARVIVYNKAAVNASDVATYESLADPKNKGKVCTRSGSHPYNLSLIGSEIAAPGRGEGGGVGQGRRGEHGARAQGRRHRPDQGGGRGGMRRRAQQHVLLRAAAAFHPAGRPRGRREDRRRLPRPGEARAPTSTFPAPA